MKKRWIVVAVLAVAVPVVVWAWPRATQRDLKTELAERFNVSDPATLFVNVPPCPDRYPGSVLTKGGDYPMCLVEGKERDLRRGAQFEIAAASTGLRSAEGGVAAGVFEELAKSSDLVEIETTLDSGHVVEMVSADVMKRIGPYKDAGAALDVIVRSFEAHVALKVRRRSSADLKAWGDLTGRVKKAADPAGAEISLGSSDDERMELQIAEPTVVAFQVCDVKEYLAATGVAAPTKVAPARSSARDAVRTMMRVDPKLAPSMDRALREMGPAAGPAILEEMRGESDPEVRRRGAQMLQRLPKETPGVVTAVPPHVVEQVRGAREFAAIARSPRTDVPTLARALDGKDAAIRLIALDALADRGKDAESALPRIKALFTSDDKAVADAAKDAARRIALVQRPPR